MAVVAVGTFTVKPDRFDDFLGQAGRFKTIIEKCGGRNCRLLAALVAGEATGSLAFTYEADDFSAFGAVQDKVMADPEGQALMASLNTSANPAGPAQLTLWVDVPL